MAGLRFNLFRLIHLYLILELVLILSGLAFSLSGQSPHPAYLQLGREQGLKSTTIFCVHQDSKGYIWIGTDRGPVRFDGKNFEEFPLQEPQLKNTSVFHIQDDGSGKVWMSTMDGSVFYFERDSIYKTLHSEIVQSYKGQFRILLDFYAEKSATTYQTLQNLGILRIDSLGNATCIKDPGCNKSLALCLDEKTLIFEQLYGCGELNINTYPHDSSSITIYGLDQGKIEVTLTTYQEAGNFSRMIKLNDTEFLIYRRGNLHHIKDWVVLNEKKFSRNACVFSVGPDGRIYIGMVNSQGLWIYDDLKDLFTGQPEILFTGHSIGSIEWDENGSCWLGSLDAGIFYVPNWNLKVIDESDGLTSSFITSVNQYEDKWILAGTRDGHIVRMDQEGKDLEVISAEPLQSFVLSSYYNKPYNKLILTSGAGDLVSFSLKEGRAIQNNIAPLNNVSAKFIYSPANKDHFWVYGAAGFNKLDLANNRLIKTSRSFNYSERTYSLIETPRGDVFIGNDSGLWQLENDSLLFPNYGSPIERSIITALEWKKDIEALVIGSLDLGIGIWDGKKMIEIKAKDGLLKSPVRVLFCDNQDIIWSGTDDGINRIQIFENDSIDIQTYSHLDGLPSDGITSIEEVEDQLVVGTKKGLVFLSKKERKHFSKVPVIQKIKLFDKQTDSNKIQSLSHQENFLSFKFITVDPGQLGQIHYRYKVREGDLWITTNENEVILPSLSPGEYRFEVQSKLKGRDWSTSAHKAFNIRLPWWKTWWFFLLTSSLLLGVVVLLYKNQLGKIRRQKEMDLELNRLERAALRAQMNPHFIFNCLNSIQSMIARDDKENANRYLSRFAQLIRSSLSMSSESRVSLKEDINMIKNYLIMEQLRFKDRFNYEIKIDEKIDLFEVDVPPMLVQPFVENSIKHGFSRIKKTGKILIEYKLLGDSLLKIEVVDNGVGFKKHQHLKESINRKSKGVSITSRRIQILKDDNQNPIKMMQLEDEQGNVVGTKVQISVPINNISD